MKMGIAIQTGGPLAVYGPKDVFLSLEEARELWEKLGVLFGQPVATPADTGRTVWATDGEGNPISPDELKARNRERSDKWADFAAGANQSDRPDYYCKSSGGPWEPFLTTFEYEPRWLSRRDSRYVRMGLTIVHSLRWGDPQVTGFGGVYRRWDCVNGFTE